MKITVVAACPFPFPRGTPIRILRLSEALARRGHDVHVVTYHLGDGTSCDGVRVSRIAKVPFYNRTSPGPSWGKLLALDPLLAVRARSVLRRERPDLVYAHHYEGLVAGLLARAGQRIPLVFDAHTTLASELPHSRILPGKNLKRGVGSVLDRRLPPLAEAVTCVNGGLRDQISELTGWDAERVTVVESGVDADLFAGRPRAPRPLDRAPTLIFAGNLAAYQGIDELLQAFAMVVRRSPRVRLRIVTSSERSLGRYGEVAEGLGVRDRIDHVVAAYGEIPGLFADADVALHPRPQCTGTPIKLLNYMAAGLPIVSFAGSAKAVTHGESAWLVPDGDVEGFARAACALLDDPEHGRELGLEARRIVRERHSWNSSAEALERLFVRLADVR